MGQSRAEQETIIRWDREEPEAHVFSANPAVWRKMARLGVPPLGVTRVRGAETGRFYAFPVAALRWKVRSEAQARAARERAARRPPAFLKRRKSGRPGPESSGPPTGG